MIYAKVKGQHLEVFADPVYSDSINFLSVKFELSDEWKEYSVTALFRDAHGKCTSVILDDSTGFYLGDNTFIVPFEAITVPAFTISLVGTAENSRITTNAASVCVAKSGYGEGDVPATPSLTEYEQLLLMCDTAKDIAQSVRDDADNGVFKGDKGDKGDRGEKGETGKAFTYSDFTPEQLLGLTGPQGAQGPTGEKGETGDAFTYSDFTSEQLEALKIKGDKGDKGEKGDAFTYSDFTPEQLSGLVGPQGPQGEKGDKGDTGDKGDSYILTVDDITEIAGIVVSNFVNVAEVGQ